MATVFAGTSQPSDQLCGLTTAMRREWKALTFADVTLADCPSDIHPNDVRVDSFISRRISVPSAGLMAAAMDTVCEAEMALAMAKAGGIGILHRNLQPEEQAAQVKWVRRKINCNGLIEKPFTFSADERLSAVQKTCSDHNWTFTSFPILDSNTHELVGLLCRDDMQFVESGDPKLGLVMKPMAKKPLDHTRIVDDAVVTSSSSSSIVYVTAECTAEQAYALMRALKVKKLPVVASANARKLEGMYVWADVSRDVAASKSTYALDEEGHFLVGAAISTQENDLERAQLLVAAGCKLLVLDSSHGGSTEAVAQLRRLRALGDEFAEQNVQIVVGNIASYESAALLLKDPAVRPDGLKVGIGPGSICSTRRVSGHGVPQLTAVHEVWRAVNDFIPDCPIPIIADGGLQSSGDMVKAFAFGASALMLGSRLAGCNESPGPVVIKGGKTYKQIRGMASRAAMSAHTGSRARYNVAKDDAGESEVLTHRQKQKLVPEGVQGFVEASGPVASVIAEMLGGIRSGLAHSGAHNIIEFPSKAHPWLQSAAGVAEGNPHSIHDQTQ